MADNNVPARLSRPLLGVLYMCVACALFPVMNGIVKLLAATYEPTQIVWFRIVVHLGLVALVFTPRMGLDLFRTQRIGLQFLSSVMMLLSTLLFFSAVKSVGVAEAISVSFVAPLAVVFLAWPFLGERITVLRVVAVMVGFLGVLVVIRPGSSVFQWALSCFSEVRSVTPATRSSSAASRVSTIPPPRSSTACFWAPSSCRP